MNASQLQEGPMNILIPRFVDRHHIRAQELSLKSMLPHFTSPGHVWSVFHHEEPDPAAAANPRVRLRWREMEAVSSPAA